MQGIVNATIGIILSILISVSPVKEIKPVEKEIMTIKIEKINLNRKIYAKESKLNNIDKNVIIMKESDYPDEKFSTVILGAHSGTGDIAFFKDLNKLSKGDVIELTYKNKKYKYTVDNLSKDRKDGKIKITYCSNEKRLILYTCYPNDKSNYLVVTSYN